MKNHLPAIVIATAMLFAGAAHAQQGTQNENDSSAGASEPVIGVTVIEMKNVTAGWSAKKDILGKPVYNDQNQRIGKVDDIIVTPDDAVSFAIIGAGGFLGIGRHDVAIPVDQIETRNNQFVLPGATKAALKAMPAFDYGRKA